MQTTMVSRENTALMMLWQLLSSRLPDGVTRYSVKSSTTEIATTPTPINSIMQLLIFEKSITVR